MLGFSLLPVVCRRTHVLLCCLFVCLFIYLYFVGVYSGVQHFIILCVFTFLAQCRSFRYPLFGSSLPPDVCCTIYM